MPDIPLCAGWEVRANFTEPAANSETGIGKARLAMARSREIFRSPLRLRP